MGRFAVISDIHSNLEALEAVLKDARHCGVEYGYCLGDVVGYGPDPAPVVQLVKEFCKATILGNHDSYLLGYEKSVVFNNNSQEAIRLNRLAVGPDEISFLEDLSYVVRAEGCFFTHASPRSPADWPYLFRPPEIVAAFDFFAEDFAFVGHTHIPMMIQKLGQNYVLVGQDHVTIPSGSRALINPGSVGQPRDEDPRAAYCIVDVEHRSVEFRRVEYPIHITQKKLRDFNYPIRLADRLSQGL